MYYQRILTPTYTYTCSRLNGVKLKARYFIVVGTEIRYASVPRADRKQYLQTPPGANFQVVPQQTSLDSASSAQSDNTENRIYYRLDTPIYTRSKKRYTDSEGWRRTKTRQWQTAFSLSRMRARRVMRSRTGRWPKCVVLSGFFCPPSRPAAIAASFPYPELRVSRR